MKTVAAALVCGLIFGLGLCVSEMVNPARVVGFLDVFGRWDATLAFVMGGALAITALAFPLVMRRARPVLVGHFSLPTKKSVDTPLIAGSVLFGIGWGLAGLCPGPAITALASLSPSVVMFVIAMVAGQWVVSWFE
jgi:uncharacterized membrane protein YedE/YeeE